MTSFFRLQALPVLAGLLVAFVTMMLFEGANSFFYPFPEGLNTADLDAVRAFAQTLPPVAFIVVLFGWGFGALFAGMIVTRLAKKDIVHARSLTFITGGILTALGALNNFVFLPGVQPLWFTIIGLPLFLIFSFLGHRLLVRR